MFNKLSILILSILSCHSVAAQIEAGDFYTGINGKYLPNNVKNTALFFVGFDRVDSSYTGNTVRLYNLTTTTTQDIGTVLNAKGLYVFDTATARLFCGTDANCRIKRFYNQTSNGGYLEADSNINAMYYCSKCTPNGHAAAIGDTTITKYNTGHFNFIGYTTENRIHCNAFTMGVYGRTYFINGAGSGPIIGSDTLTGAVNSKPIIQYRFHPNTYVTIYNGDNTNGTNSPSGTPVPSKLTTTWYAFADRGDISLTTAFVNGHRWWTGALTPSTTRTYKVTIGGKYTATMESSFCISEAYLFPSALSDRDIENIQLNQILRYEH